MSIFWPIRWNDWCYLIRIWLWCGCCCEIQCCGCYHCVFCLYTNSKYGKPSFSGSFLFLFLFFSLALATLALIQNSLRCKYLVGHILQIFIAEAKLEPVKNDSFLHLFIIFVALLKLSVSANINKRIERASERTRRANMTSSKNYHIYLLLFLRKSLIILFLHHSSFFLHLVRLCYIVRTLFILCIGYLVSTQRFSAKPKSTKSFFFFF